MNRLIAKWEEYKEASLAPLEQQLDERAAFLAGARALAGLFSTYGDEPALWRELEDAEEAIERP